MTADPENQNLCEQVFWIFKNMTIPPYKIEKTDSVDASGGEDPCPCPWPSCWPSCRSPGLHPPSSSRLPPSVITVHVIRGAHSKNEAPAL
jgi:hypothetical protein